MKPKDVFECKECERRIESNPEMFDHHEVTGHTVSWHRDGQLMERFRMKDGHKFT